ncbi:MAG TPA: bifunctional phosphopantothenoylcysteine decarboxylase/phosphopantothenate synthase [Candidatus Dormibacteraeota bacterium]
MSAALGHQDPLSGRRIAVYVSGSIAAYKACEVVSSLRRAQAEVRVAMTEAAIRLVTPMTFQSLSANPVSTSVWDDAAGAAAEGAHHGMGHIGLSAWAELQVAVPASADLIARLALGLADDAVTTAALACLAPLVVAPAMETAMWEHPATQAHLATLVARGAVVVGPETGRLASGHEGGGRMSEPAAVVAAIAAALPPRAPAARLLAFGPTPLSATHDPNGGPDDPGEAPAPAPGWLHGHHVVVTAGGTREPIDPVRYIGNHSSGKMGAALALEARRLGARVTLITAAARPALEDSGIDVIEVATAAGMLDAVRRWLPGAAVLVMAAAVADYRPAAAAPQKLKKRGAGLTLELVPTVDVLTELRSDPARAGVFVVGFAAETDDLVANARQKLTDKGLDLIVANDVSNPEVGMGSDDNLVSILAPDGGRVDAGPAPKPVIAARIFDVIRGRMPGRGRP